MTKLSDVLDVVVNELDATHDADGFVTLPDDYLPNFIVTRSGSERHFTKRAQDAVGALVIRLYSDRSEYQDVVRQEQFRQLVRSCVADLHAEARFATTPSEGRARLKLLEQELEDRLRGVQLPFGHAFPATTLGIEAKGTYWVGPVEVASVKDWFESITLSARNLRQYGIPESSDWRAELHVVLQSSERRGVRPNSPDYLEELVEAFHGCDAVVSIAVSGLEQHYSREVARMAARTALDGISLLSRRGGTAFSQQALSDERLPPLRSHSVVGFKGEHWIGGSWTERAIPVRQGGIRSNVFGDERMYESLCEVVGCLVDSRSHRHPQLAMRWAAALEWYAEGCREASATLAVTKLASSLDVLTCGRTANGITQMMTNLLGITPNDPVFENDTASLRQVVQRIYGDGRSQLLHGNHVDREVAFDEERGQARALADFALLNLLKRLSTYQGPDTEFAFIDMPP